MPDKPVTWSWKGQIDDSHSDGVISSLSVGCWTGYVEGSTMQSVHEECVDSAKKWFISQCGSKDIPNTFDVWRSECTTSLHQWYFWILRILRGVSGRIPGRGQLPAQSSVMLSVFHVFHGKLHRDLQGRQRFTSADSLVKDSKRKPREASKESNPKDIRQCQKQESKIIQIQRREMASSEFGQGLVAVGSFPRNIQYSRFPRNMLDLRYCISLWICRGDARAMSFENRVKLVLTTINCEIETKQ